MDQTDLTTHLSHLIDGLGVLQRDYETLFSQHRALEAKLTTARDQYNELAKLLEKNATVTPPLSLTSTAPTSPKAVDKSLSAIEILELRNDHDAARGLQSAIDASKHLKQAIERQSPGVKIWSGASADTNAVQNKLPSITESPMEQDFTVVGTPSRLGCPFASMANKKLSSHAASVLSRYHGSQSTRDGQSRNQDNVSITGSGASRVNGRESLLGRQARSRRRSSMVDPIKAEICGLVSHDSIEQQPSSSREQEIEPVAQEEPGVCPIRFLNQHSPEELAQYFEKHKHELPRSHEVCVRRYQSNEQQVRELDAKYSDVAQMIRGLGEKHQNYLPKDVEEADAVVGDDDDNNVRGNGRVEKWARSLSPQGALHETQQLDAQAEEEAREPHFARPLRDVRLGESPSRPWGIQVPAQYAEKGGSESSAPVQINTNVAMPADHLAVDRANADGARCPFAAAMGTTVKEDQPAQKATLWPDVVPAVQPTDPAQQSYQATTRSDHAGSPRSLVINGPIVVGFGPEEAARFIQSLGQQQVNN